MRKFTLVCTLLVFTLLLTGCGKKNKTKAEIPAETPTVNVKNGSHTWYCFGRDSIVKIDKPQSAPYNPMTPWTEAVRISSANVCVENEETGDTKAFAIVNRLGVLSFNDGEVVLAPDVTLFTDRTCGNLVFLNETPVFTVYKSAFFNDTITDPLYKDEKTQHLFLVQFDDTTKISYPIVNCNNLTTEPNSEITDSSWDGLNWTCSVKTITDVKNIFSYITWKPTAPLLSISPITAKDNIVIEEIDADTFRNAQVQLNYRNAPERVKKLLAGFSSSVPFNLELKSAGGSSPRAYVNELPESPKQVLNAKGIIAQSWSCVLFEDGTMFIEGALPGKHILRGGKPIAIRLPKLPAGYVYSDFVISGTTLYAAWEETTFYQTARSGFLQVNLEKSLYSKLL